MSEPSYRISTVFLTSDICLAACLKVSGFEVIGVEINDNGKGTFQFSKVPQVAEFLFKYDTGSCKVEPVAFHSAIKQLTTMVRRQNNISKEKYE